ncbi:MAG: hypothetical protein CMJ58_22195 [Planctomycetaceae bacterium]|nr:hypothetical protein [Planctomycetaceae bacterium]
MRPTSCHTALRRFAFAALLLSVAPTGRLLAADRPNIMMIFADDAGYADFGFTSDYLGRTTEFVTPNLDQLAAQSVFAPQTYVTSSTCAVSRAGLLTGRYQQRFGFHFNAIGRDVPYEGVAESETLLFEQMKALDYNTAAIGKWHIGQQPQWQPHNQGVDYFFGTLSGGNYYFYSAGSNTIRRNETLVDWGSEPSFNGIPNDPQFGRELTDAFSDEASQYIAEHAGDEQPFMLYFAPTAPHTPYQAKGSDFRPFDNSSLTGNRKIIAAMTYALDRAVGTVLSRLDDPNGDGDTSDSIANNTIVVFSNDNGGANEYYDNGPLAGLKGGANEGGIRVPTLIRAPGLAPGIYDKQISTMDFFATFVAAAQGEPIAPLDGVDLMPYLTGADNGVPHQYLFQHNREVFSAAQDEEWKLVKARAQSPWQLHRLNPDGSGEDVDLSAQYPEKVAELVRAFVAFEVQTEKGTNTRPRYYHPGNTFIFRDDQPYTNIGWSNPDGWINEAGDPTGVGRNDSTSRFVAVFRPNETKDYVAVGRTTRAASHSPETVAAGHPDLPGLDEFMLNELRLAGSFAGDVNRSATLQGNALLFANSPDGPVAKIGLDATDDSASADFAYDVQHDIELYHDLHLAGDGTVRFEISGQIRDFYEPRSIFKEGTSRVTLTGDNSFAGDVTVAGGTLELAGDGAAIGHARHLVVSAGAEFRQAGGLAVFDSAQLASGAQLSLAGGEIVVGEIADMAGAAEFEIGGIAWENYGHLAVAGLGDWGGTLTVTLAGGFEPVAGDAFWLLDAQQVAGAFDAVNLPSLPSGLSWNASALLTEGVVAVESAASVLTEAADFNQDLSVDDADLAIWRQWLGQRTSRGDANGDFRVDGADFLAWQAAVGGGGNAAVPEPDAAAALLCLLAAGAAVRTWPNWRRRRAATR